MVSHRSQIWNGAVEIIFFSFSWKYVGSKSSRGCTSMIPQILASFGFCSWIFRVKWSETIFERINIRISNKMWKGGVVCWSLVAILSKFSFGFLGAHWHLHRKLFILKLSSVLIEFKNCISPHTLLHTQSREVNQFQMVCSALVGLTVEFLRHV